MNNLISKLITNGYLRTDLIIEAFSEINRVDFVLPEMETEAESDVALPIGYGQTISQPSTLAFMLELLSPEIGNNILDIGSGSGWTTALLGRVAGEKGQITAVEKNPELMKMGEENVRKYADILKSSFEFHCADGRAGFLENAPYDRILVSATTYSVPEELKKQLKVGGKMVLPINDSLVYLEKKSDTDFYEEKYPGFSFVPLN